MPENHGISTRRVLVTGGAGFIGSHLVDQLLAQGDSVTVLDNFNEFYDPRLKRSNIKSHLGHANYRLVEGDVRQDQSLEAAFSNAPFDVVVHLAAMAGVRPSIRQPAHYMDVNVSGTQKLVDWIVSSSTATRLVFGSSSSVYGQRSGDCFCETDRVDQPLSPYAASKISGEALLYAAHHTTALPVVCLRFFTVYGPRQRPDLAIHKFSSLIDKNEPLEVFGDGSSRRDYTFVSDIIAGVLSAMGCRLPGYEIINLGRSDPVTLMEMIRTLEEAFGKKANLVFKPPQPGDMPYTYASIDKARKLLGYEPRVSFADGVQQFAAWYRTDKEPVASRADS